MARRTSGRRWAFAAAVLFVVAAVIGGALLLLGDLDVGSQIAGIVGGVITALGLPVAVYAAMVARNQASRSEAVEGSDRVDAAVGALEVSMTTQWEAEERIRRIHDPFPLPVRWQAADEVMDHWRNINGSPGGSTPAAIAGRFDNAAEALYRIPSRRLVITGDAGSGKTVLAVRLALVLLESRRSPQRPLPVVFTLSGWDPGAQDLLDWMIEVLEDEYPVLLETAAQGQSLAWQLVMQHRVFPILDGFDEIAEEKQREAIRRVNSAMGPSDGYVLTSRYDEFASAVGASDVLTAAAVVRIEPLDLDDVAEYLPLTTRRGRAGATKWQPVLTLMRTDPRGRLLASVMVTPLMVALARAIFSDTDRDPRSLLDDVDVADPAASREKVGYALLSEFIPAVYDDRPRPEAENAERHLRFVAMHLKRTRQTDLGWWSLILSVPRVLVGASAFLLIFVIAAAGAGFAGWFGYWTHPSSRAAWIAATLIGSVVCASGGGVVVGVTRGIRRSPARALFRVDGRLQEIVTRAWAGMRSWQSLLWITVWLVGGAIFGISADRLANSGDVLPVGVLAGAGSGAGIWLVVTLVHILGSPIEPTEIISPAELLRIERRAAVQQAVTVGTGGAAVFWIMLWAATEPAFEVPFDVLYPNGLWIAGFFVVALSGFLIWILFVTVWGTWLIAPVMLPLGGRLPWAVMRFLVDAHGRGVLRRNGGVYQFRHARLREHLARPNGPT